MATFHPYFNFMGNTETAFNFYKSVFGGEFSALQRFSDFPAGADLPEKERNMIMHISYPIGVGTVLMATDMLESAGHKLIVGNQISISVNAESEAEADKIFNGLSAGGSVQMPLEKTFWGAYFGMCTDQFGIQWMVNYDYPKEAN